MGSNTIVTVSFIHQSLQRSHKRSSAPIPKPSMGYNMIHHIQRCWSYAGVLNSSPQAHPTGQVLGYPCFSTGQILRLSHLC
ncbi:hypothetical protein FKM82_019995 [Ascaphus truei]